MTRLRQAVKGQFLKMQVGNFCTTISNDQTDKKTFAYTLTTLHSQSKETGNNPSFVLRNGVAKIHVATGLPFVKGEQVDYLG